MDQTKSQANILHDKGLNIPVPDTMEIQTSIEISRIYFPI